MTNVSFFKLHSLSFILTSPSDFRMVLRSFLHIMLKGGSAIWSNEQPDYPLIVFDSIKDNLSYIAIIRGLGESDLPEEVNPWYLYLPQEMLKSTWDFPIFPELAAKIFAFICDELQHERFLNKQHLISEVGMKVCSHRFCPGWSVLIAIEDSVWSFCPSSLAC